MATTTAWQDWEQLCGSQDPDPIEVLEAVAAFQRYFAAVEREAIKAARSQGRTWQEIGTALHRSRQALWQRVASRHDDPGRAEWPDVLEASWVQTAEVRHQVGLPPG